MEARILEDERILDILKRDSQRGIVLLMEKYTGLIWHVISLHLENTEDIKECINDTFTEFYFRRKKFDPNKSSLSVYLSAIARKRAVSRYRREKIRRMEALDEMEEEAGEEDRQLKTAELRIDIEKALLMLKPNELQIIRMKYYDGMSVREIADSLELPYETVKKRHQRSVLKLGQSLLLVFVLVIMLTACVYGVLRYLDIIPPINLWSWPWTWEEKEESDEEPEDDTGGKDVVELHLHDTAGNDTETMPEIDIDEEISEEFPFSTEPVFFPPDVQEEPVNRELTVMEEYKISPNYGVNLNPAEPVYALAEKSFVENEEYSLTLEDAYYINHRITATVRLSLKTATLNDWWNVYRWMDSVSVSYRENVWMRSYESSRTIDQYTELLVCYFDNVTLPDIDEGICKMSILFKSGDNIIFDMVSVDRDNVTAFPYQIGEFGGILAVPRLEDGSLIIAIHPLDDKDEYQIVPAIVVDSGSSGPAEGITVTGEDGTVLTGECIGYRPWGEETYFEWNFGKAKPGRYTLNIPWVYLKKDMDEEYSMPVNLLENSWEEKKYEISNGSIWIEECTLLDEKPENWLKYQWFGSTFTSRNWRLRMGYFSENPKLTIMNFYGLLCNMDCYPVERPNEEEDYFGEFNFYYISNDVETNTMEFAINVDLALADPESAYLYFSDKSVVNYRWNQNFEIPFTVQEIN